MQTRLEQNMITLSACGALFFAVLAVVWGMLAKSQMILFDGVYSLISVMLMGLYYYVSLNVVKERDERFPFGRTAMEPMLIIFQSVLLLVICFKALSYSVTALFSGGNDVNNLAGMVYAVIGTAGCFGVWLYISRKSGGKSASGLMKALAGPWFMDTLLSFGVLLGFLIGFIIERLGYVQYARYVDPFMVLVAVLFFIREPILGLFEGTRGVLVMAPEKAMRDASQKTINETATRYGFNEMIMWLGKTGSQLICDVSLVAKDPSAAYTAKEMTATRKEMETRLCELSGGTVRLHLSFVNNEKEK